LYYGFIFRVNPKEPDLTTNILIKRRLSQLLPAAKAAHSVIWEAFWVMESILSLILRIAIAPFLLIIIMADVVIAMTILSVVGIFLGFMFGWITPAGAVTFADAHLTVVFQDLAGALQGWAATHQDAPIAHAIGAIGQGD